MRMNRHKPSLAAALAVVMAVLAPLARADGDGERGALERLIGEIAALEPLVAEAERQSDPRDRSRFAYDWLRADLDRMRRGIRDHLERPRNEPAFVAPLVGDYGR